MEKSAQHGKKVALDPWRGVDLYWQWWVILLIRLTGGVAGERFLVSHFAPHA